MRRIRYYHMFPCAIPVQGADHPRVTHPSAASPAEAGFARLACLRRAASVRSEPGSNSPSLNPLSQGQRNVNFIHPVCSHEPAFPSTLPLFVELTEAYQASFSLLFPSLIYCQESSTPHWRASIRYITRTFFVNKNLKIF